MIFISILAILIVISIVGLIILSLNRTSIPSHKEYKELYLKIQPYNTFFLPVSPLYNLYVEEVGNHNGIPIIFIHGGKDRRFFNPRKFRVILFDRRGSGKSMSSSKVIPTTNNTTWDLVSDIEKIRFYLNIEKWHIFGGSWGSTLSLSYAIMHPDKVITMIIRGIPLARPKDSSWFFRYGPNQVFPKAWAEFLKPIEKYQMLQSENEEIVRDAVFGWYYWEITTGYTSDREQMINNLYNTSRSALLGEFSASSPLILCYYDLNNYFMPSNNWILDNAGKISQIPITIVQGEYDFICPTVSAWDLYNKLKSSSTLYHSSRESLLIDALVKSTDKIV